MSYKNRSSRLHVTNVSATFAFLVVLSYFTYHAISGERGFLALMQLSRQVDDAKLQLDTARAERLTLEHRVNLLRPESLDLDLLEEQARESLGYVYADEMVFER